MILVVRALMLLFLVTLAPWQAQAGAAPCVGDSTPLTVEHPIGIRLDNLVPRWEAANNRMNLTIGGCLRYLQPSPNSPFYRGEVQVSFFDVDGHLIGNAGQQIDVQDHPAVATRSAMPNDPAGYQFGASAYVGYPIELSRIATHALVQVMVMECSADIADPKREAGCVTQIPPTKELHTYLWDDAFFTRPVGQASQALTKHAPADACAIVSRPGDGVRVSDVQMTVTPSPDGKTLEVGGYGCLRVLSTEDADRYANGSIGLLIYNDSGNLIFPKSDPNDPHPAAIKPNGSPLWLFPASDISPDGANGQIKNPEDGIRSFSFEVLFVGHDSHHVLPQATFVVTTGGCFTNDFSSCRGGHEYYVQSVPVCLYDGVYVGRDRTFTLRPESIPNCPAHAMTRP